MTSKKITTREKLVKVCEKWRQEGHIIGFTSGAFDILHAGHIDYLAKAKDNCDFLIIGLNSDVSVKRYKGKGRPIINQQERAEIVAALEMVDYVFIFEERRNKKNIEVLQPDLYIKAGDYNSDQLTSKEAVEIYGGKVLLIPVTTDTSTSKIINKIYTNISGTGEPVTELQNSVYIPVPEMKSKPAIFLDRDGTINKDIEYLHEPDKFQLIPNAIPGLKKMQDMGFRLIIITNQGGIGLGYFTKEDFYSVNRKMFSLFSEQSIKIDKIYFCPHNVTENCTCRKPKTGLIEQAKKDLNPDMDQSFMIGDKTADIQTGKNAGLKNILVRTGKAGQDKEYQIKPDFIAKDLLDAANWILEQERK